MVKIIYSCILPFAYVNAQRIVRDLSSMKSPPPPEPKTGCDNFCTNNDCTNRGNKNADIFLAYGPTVDTMGANHDDNYEGPMVLPTGIPFFGSTVNSIYFSTNGLITFGNGFSGYTSSPLPISGRSFLSPFWSDLHPGLGGSWGYRQLSTTDLNSASAMIRSDYDLSTFIGTEGVVVTWKDIKAYGSPSSSDMTNTIQAIMITDNNNSFAIYNYGDMEWATGTASGGDACTGLGGTPALVGFNDGLGNYYSTPQSQTDAIIDIEDSSNCGRVGRYIYKLDGVEIVDALDVVEQLPETTEDTITIIENRFQAWIEFVDSAENMENHGCWCSRFSEMNEIEVGTPINFADRLCKFWVAARRCVNKQDGACYGDEDETYELLNGNCNAPAGSCGAANCAIDQHFASAINELEIANEDVNTEPYCDNNTDWIPTDTCCGEAPSVSAYSSATHTCNDGQVQ